MTNGDTRLGPGGRVAAIVMGAVLVLTATPAVAVVDGQQDTESVYANVGQLVKRFDGEWFGACSGTLVGEAIVLTAAHCVDDVIALDGLGIEDVGIVFDPMPGPASILYGVDRIEVHPDWLTRSPVRGGGRPVALGPGAEDVALMWLSDPVAGIEPASIIAAGGLDALDLTGETFTVVGYGFTEFVTGSLLSPRWEAEASGRSFRNVSVITEHEAIADRYLMITASACFGDSGGPLLLGETVVAVNTWTSSWRCEAPAFSYRLDAERAQWFLDAWLS